MYVPQEQAVLGFLVAEVRGSRRGDLARAPQTRRRASTAAPRADVTGFSQRLRGPGRHQYGMANRGCRDARVYHPVMTKQNTRRDILKGGLAVAGLGDPRLPGMGAASPCAGRDAGALHGSAGERQSDARRPTGASSTSARSTDCSRRATSSSPRSTTAIPMSTRRPIA